MPGKLYRGETAELSVNFYDPTDITQPLKVTSPVRFKVRDFNRNLIASGIANQSETDTSRWFTRLTIPRTADVTPPDHYYKIAWQAISDNSQIIDRTEFEVVDLSDTTPYDPTVVALIGTPFTVQVKIPFKPTGMSVRIVNAQGNVLATKCGIANFDFTTSHDGFIYNAKFTNANMPWQSVMARGGMSACYAYVNYLTPDEQERTEVYPVYFVNTILMNMMNDMRQYLDMLRNQDVIAQLRYSEAKLIHFAYQGLLRINAVPPTWVQLDFATLGSPIGQSYYFWALKAAQMEILDAMYLAEGMTSFEFSGMSVQLNSDRTQYIEAAADKIRSDFENNLPKAKMQTAQRGGLRGNMGTMNIIYGPNTNFVFSGYGAFGTFGVDGSGLLWNGAGIVPLPFLY